jgi:hypothetical protein
VEGADHEERGPGDAAGDRTHGRTSDEEGRAVPPAFRNLTLLVIVERTFAMFTKYSSSLCDHTIPYGLDQCARGERVPYGTVWSTK